jgi:hypothetical protein|tara:strand:+ start:191 stop:502 length:312 start_codon:yes stop_codon:yes gene_type:complete
MELKELSKKPQLIKLTIDKENLVEKYGDTLEFHIYDRQPLDVFAKLANQKDDLSGVTELIQDMILDSTGKPVVSDGQILPVDILMEAIAQVTNELGKSQPIES